MSNQHDYTCPVCGDQDTLEIVGYRPVRVGLSISGTVELGENANVEWEDDSDAHCSGCGWDGVVHDLRRIVA